jgi:ribonuclease HI
MAHVEIYTDGSCKGNGRADGGRGGWAAILSCNGKTKELSGTEPNTTNFPEECRYVCISQQCG